VRPAEAEGANLAAARQEAVELFSRPPWTVSVGINAGPETVAVAHRKRNVDDPAACRRSDSMGIRECANESMLNNVRF